MIGKKPKTTLSTFWDTIDQTLKRLQADLLTSMKKALSLCFILLLGFSSNSQAEFRHFNEWTKKEKGAFIAYTTVTWIDHKQTQWALNNPCECYKESNTLLYGSDPSEDKSLLINTILLSSIYWTVGTFEPDASVSVIGTGALIRLGAVVSNDQIGVSWQVAF